MELYQLVRKAARAVQKEEQRPNPLKRIRLVRVTRLGTKIFQSLSNIKFLLELVVGHHQRLVAGSWLYQGKSFTANEKFANIQTAA